MEPLSLDILGFGDADQEGAALPPLEEMRAELVEDVDIDGVGAFNVWNPEGNGGIVARH